MDVNDKGRMDIKERRLENIKKNIARGRGEDRNRQQDEEDEYQRGAAVNSERSSCEPQESSEWGESSVRSGSVVRAV